MFDNDARQFLEKPLIARLSTISSDGYPHNVPIWYLLDGDDVYFISDRAARKTQNALANPKGAAVIGGDTDEDAGYLIQGDLHVETDADHRMMMRMTDRYEEGEAAEKLKAEWQNDDIVIIRLHAQKVIRVR